MNTAKIILLLLAAVGLSACASSPEAGDALSGTVSFIVEHKPDVSIDPDGCVKVRFEEGSPEKGRVALSLYPPCKPKEAPE